MNRVFGDGGFEEEGLILRTMRNLESDDWKDLRAVSSCGRILRKELFVVLIVTDRSLAQYMLLLKRNAVQELVSRTKCRDDLDTDESTVR